MKSTRFPIRDALAYVVLACAVSSLALFTIAASVYPGGNHFDHSAPGHDFWRNALCDVARSTAVGGASNVLGATFARAAMAIMALGIGAMFWLLSQRLSSTARLATGVRVLGTVTVPGALSVVLLPSDRFSCLHGVAVVAAGFPGLGAALLATVGLVREKSSRIVTTVAIATLAVAAVDFSIYVDELITRGPPRLLVPVLERIATILLVVWMVTSTARAR